MIRTSFIAAMGVALGLASPGFAEPFCRELLSADQMPKTYKKLGPVYSDQTSGWIFPSDQLKAEFAVTDEVRALWSGLGAAFEAADTRLAVLPVPPRPAIAGQAARDAAGVPNTYDADAVLAEHSAYVSALNAAGLPAPDLSVLPEGIAAQYYFRKDTHWTPKGAYYSAAAMAQALGHAPHAPHAMPQSGGVYEERGSLSALIEDVCGARPAAETVPDVLYSQVGSLLGDVNLRKSALVGTSFSNRYQTDAYQVAGALASATGGDIHNASLSGGGLAGAMTAFLTQPDLDLSQFETVIWETPYTTPLTDTHGLRQVLGTLHATKSTQRTPLFAGALGGDWHNIKKGFDATQFKALELYLPGIDAGIVTVDLISEAGDKMQVKLVKSDRVPAAQRSDRWVLALDAMPQTDIARVKVKIRKGGATQEAVLSLLQ